MDISKQVCSLIQAKKLKELGVSQSNYFSWFGDETRRLMDNGADKAAEYGPWLFVAPTQPRNAEDADHRSNVGITEPLASAFTVAELGVMLDMASNFVTKHHGKWKAEYTHDNVRPEEKNLGTGTTWYLTWHETEASARAAFLIYSLECKFITAAEVNDRLIK